MKGVYFKVELLLNMTIAGTATAIIILLIKQAFKNKLTPKWHFYIWMILAVRLLIPGMPESDISIFNTIPTAQNVVMVERQLEEIKAEDSGENFMEGNISMKMPISGVQRDRSISITKQKVDIILIGWLAVMAVMTIYLMGTYMIFNNKARKMPLCSDPEIIELLEECKRETGILNKTITVRLGSSTPMLYGIIKPTILISDGYTIKELRHILIHELCHYKHKDVIYNIICCVFLCFYWFNPIMWLCFYVIRRDIELLCDQRVIQITGERKEYASVLLKTALRKNQFMFATSTMQNGEKEVVKRIKYIAYFKKPKVWISTLALIIAVFLAIICLTDASINNTAIIDAGEGYFYKVPESWISNAEDDTKFYNEEGEIIGGINTFRYTDPNIQNLNVEEIHIPTPNHSQILERREIKDMPFSTVFINLDMDSESAAQEAERNESGDSSPSIKINQNHIYINIYPDENSIIIYNLWANSNQVTERELIKIAKTFKESPYPQGYQPEIQFKEDWNKTAHMLLNDYFQNYVDTEMTRTSDISGYEIKTIEQYMDRDASWSVIYPNVAVYKVDYVLDIAYPDKYSFAGGGFQVGEGKKTKIYNGELALFQVDQNGSAKFLGFVWPQNIGDLGESMAILHTISYTNYQVRAEALLENKTPYIGAHIKVGQMIHNLPLAEYFTGMELQTKKEPYGLTINYDLSEIGAGIYENSLDRELTDSRGWDLNIYLKSQLYKNSVMLLSLIDNAYSITISISGTAETGVPYQCPYNFDRDSVDKQFTKDVRLNTKSLEEYCEFLSILDDSMIVKE